MKQDIHLPNPDIHILNPDIKHLLPNIKDPTINSDIKHLLSNLKDPVALCIIATEGTFDISNNNYQYTLRTRNVIHNIPQDSVALNTLVSNYQATITNSNDLQKYARDTAANLLINKVLSAKIKNILKYSDIENSNIEIEASYENEIKSVFQVDPNKIEQSKIEYKEKGKIRLGFKDLQLSVELDFNISSFRDENDLKIELQQLLNAVVPINKDDYVLKYDLHIKQDFQNYVGIKNFYTYTFNNNQMSESDFIQALRIENEIEIPFFEKVKEKLIQWYTDIVKFFSATQSNPINDPQNETHYSTLPFQNSPHIEFIHKEFPDNIDYKINCVGQNNTNTIDLKANPVE